MKAQNKYYIFFILILFFNCVSKKSTIEYKEKIVKDTIYKNVKETIIERFTDTLVINKVCDSVGNLKPFKQLIKTNQGNISLTGINNNITAEIDLKGYKKIWEQEYKSKYNSNTQIKEVEVIKYKTSTSVILALVISILINIFLIKSRFF